MNATFTKLRNGNWGARVNGSPCPGQTLTISRRDGSTVTKTVDKVIWSGQGVTLCSLEDERPSSSNRGHRSGCRECGGPIRHAAHHRAMGGLCGGCAFDEFDC